MKNGNIEVRDRRKRRWLWMHYDTLGYISKSIGSTGLLVYAWLCYYVDWQGGAEECWPHHDTLAEKACLTRKTVIEALKELEKFKIINIKRTGRANIYTLLDIPSLDFIETVVLKDASRQLDKAQTSMKEVKISKPLMCKNYTSDIAKEVLTYKNQEPFINNQLPSINSNKEPSELFQKSCLKAISNGFNIYQLIAKFKQDQSIENDLPEEVIIKICDQFINEKHKIKNRWAWFYRVLQRELQLHSHYLIKNDQTGGHISSILKEMVNR